MASAFVLINSEVGREHEILDELKSLKEVAEAHLVSGQYDIVAKLHDSARSNEKPQALWQIKKMEGIMSTLTMVVSAGEAGGK